MTKSNSLRLSGTEPRQQRFDTPGGYQVTARTIGTRLAFQLPITNMSRTGMMIEWSKDLKVPFNVNSILELEVSAGSSEEPITVGCLGKVVRTTTANGVNGFGIKIIQADTDNQVAWQQLVGELDAPGYKAHYRKIEG